MMFLKRRELSLDSEVNWNGVTIADFVHSTLNLYEILSSESRMKPQGSDNCQKVYHKGSG